MTNKPNDGHSLYLGDCCKDVNFPDISVSGNESPKTFALQSSKIIFAGKINWRHVPSLIKSQKEEIGCKGTSRVWPVTGQSEAANPEGYKSS